MADPHKCPTCGSPDQEGKRCEQCGGQGYRATGLPENRSGDHRVTCPYCHGSGMSHAR